LDFPRDNRCFTSLLALRRYPFVGKDRGSIPKRDLHLHVLSDKRERDDTVGPYRKSLLYLVSRALEDWHKTPILGMEQALRYTEEDKGLWSPNTLSVLRKWRKSMDGVAVHTLGAEEVSTAIGQDEQPITLKAAHGSFDNDIEVITRTLLRITGRNKLTHPVRDLRY